MPPDPDTARHSRSAHAAEVEAGIEGLIDRPTSTGVIQVLLVEDSPEYAAVVQKMLSDRPPVGSSFGFSHCESLADACQWLSQSIADCVLLDLALPDGRGLHVLRRVQATVPEVPIVILSGGEEEDVAVEAVQAGAEDYLVKTHIDGYLLRRAIRYALERKQMQVKLKRSAEEIHDLYDNSPCGYHSLDQDGTFVRINETELAWLGYERDEVIGRMKFADLLPGESLLRFREGFARLTRGEAVRGQEFDLVRRNGSMLSVLMDATAIRDIDGHFLMSRSTLFDISERKRAEQALREAEEGFRRAFDDAPIGMALFSVNPPSSARFIQFNRALCDITGCSEDELATTDFQAMTHPDDMEAERYLLEQLLSGAIPNYLTEKRYLRPDGEVTWVLHNASTVRDSLGRVLYGIGQVQDISERKRAEQRLASTAAELERQTQELERSNQDLQRFAYVASHDLSEPLRMVSSYVQLLARRYRGRLDADADDFITFAVEGTERMHALITGILTYSRAGTADYAQESVDCTSVTQAVVASMNGRLEETGAEIAVDALPTVKGDPTQLSQLFQNLICNGIKFVDAGPARVHLSADRVAGAWRFSVADNGVGVERKYAERIFGVFERLHSHDAYSGSGVGLALCKRIVERHGGRIWVEPGREGGSVFCFTIPDREEARTRRPF